MQRSVRNRLVEGPLALNHGFGDADLGDDLDDDDDLDFEDDDDEDFDDEFDEDSEDDDDDEPQFDSGSGYEDPESTKEDWSESND